MRVRSGCNQELTYPDRAKRRFAIGLRSIGCLGALWLLSLPLITIAQTSGSKPASAMQAQGSTTKVPATTSQSSGTQLSLPDGKPAVPTATVQLHKQLPGDFTYQFVTHNGDITAPTPLPAPATADSPIPLALPAGDKPDQTELQIVDSGRGNVARLPVSTSAILPLTESSFTYVEAVRVPVQAQGKAAIGVQVSLASGDKKFNQSLLLQPADNGIATFRNVPLGSPVTATVTYGSHPPEIQTKTLTQDHPAEGYSWPAIALDWQDVKTTGAPPMSTTPVAANGAVMPPLAEHGATGATPPSDIRIPANPPSPGNGILNGLAGNLISLLLLAGIVYGVWWAYTNGKVKILLDKVGIQTAPITDAGASAPNPFTASERKPVQPITEGTADPLIGGVASNGVASGYTPAGSGPRLVATMGAYAGSVFPLQGGAVDIGRDASNGVPLPQDTNTSRRHATIQSTNGQYHLIDNGSSNGTYLNGVRIAGQAPQALRPGDEVQIGQTRFRFEA